MAKEKINTLDKSIKEAVINDEPKLSLDDIIIQYSKIASQIEDSGGEVTEELEKELVITQENIKHKLCGYRYIILKNESIINGLYKTEIEKLQNRTKSLTRTNDYFKQKACIAAEIFGENNKYKSDVINVSSVETVSLDVNEEEVNKSLTNIRDAIFNTRVEHIEEELELVKTSLTIEATPEVLSNILAVIYNSDSEKKIGTEQDEITLNVSLNRKAAKELVQEVEETNEGLIAQYEHYCKQVPEEDRESIPKPVLNKIAFKGLSLKTSHYPRFS